MTSLEAMDLGFTILALTCYIAGLPNAGHFFMFMLVLIAIHDLKHKE